MFPPPFIGTRAVRRRVHDVRIGWLCVWALVLAIPHSYSQAVREVSGHVLCSETGAVQPEVLVMAWPCGQSTVTDFEGMFRIACAMHIDSLTFIARNFQFKTLVPTLGVHIEVGLAPLHVALVEVQIEARRLSDPEAHSLIGADLLSALDATPGLQSLDLGAGMIQPVIRGLFGSRVTVAEDGVPQQGGRWGSDHGILTDPDLFAAVEWVPGGGHIGLGPEAIGGGLLFKSPVPANDNSTVTRAGLAARSGDLRTKVHVLHVATHERKLWYAGASGAAFGPQTVPQTAFSYLGRTYALTGNRLPNTAGTSAHAVIGFDRPLKKGGNWRGSLRAADVVQGLFPGIVGVPRQTDLAESSAGFEVNVPQQHAQRWAGSLTWKSARRSRGVAYESNLAVSHSRRLELAPPHAHGWGPEPDSPVSLSLNEVAGFAEFKRLDVATEWGVQGEFLRAETAGWEFLVPGHHRMRLSWLGEHTVGRHRFGLRTDAVFAQQAGHSEPLYNAQGLAMGTDIRAVHHRWTLPSGAMSWQVNVLQNKPNWEGVWTLSAYSRVPSNYEWGANGIHHGTFRFEQGNPSLRPEKAVEARFRLEGESVGTRQASKGISLQAFAAFHQDFIALTPSALFAPIAHAGQVYAFQAADAFRTGVEATSTYRWGDWLATAQGSVLGQWQWETGLGLPFTAPPQIRLRLEHRPSAGFQWNLSSHALGPARLTARNEQPTPGSVIWDGGLTWPMNCGTWSLTCHNLFNTAWLDHTSAYRALGLVSQGRWIQLRFTTSVRRFHSPHS